ncbi:Putative phage protein [Xenorhabdus bovienii]|uniref:Putative phage protein n=2 Tax=Xenorhabdus bovienii TaxID=40576 RepID=A0A0B6X3L6_XENBV|nr:Putative phage protein [Xenorhabdus bovienii]
MRAVRQTIATVLKSRKELPVLDGDGETDVSDMNHFITVNRVTSELIGEEYKFDADREVEIITVTRETLISVNAFGKNSYLIIEKLATVLRTSYAQSLLTRIGAGLVRKSQIRNLPTAIAGGKEQRAQIDLTLSHIHRIETPMNQARTVDITVYED